MAVPVAPYAVGSGAGTPDNPWSQVTNPATGKTFYTPPDQVQAYYEQYSSLGYPTPVAPSQPAPSQESLWVTNPDLAYQLYQQGLPAALEGYDIQMPQPTVPGSTLPGYVVQPVQPTPETTTIEVRLSDLSDGSASVIGSISVAVKQKLEDQIRQEAIASYDEQVAKLPSNMEAIESKEEFVNRAILSAIVTVTTTESNKGVISQDVWSQLESEFLSKQGSGIGFGAIVDAIEAAGLEVPRGRKVAGLGYKSITKEELKEWYEALSAKDKASVLSNFVPHSTIASIRRTGTQLASMIPIYGTVKYWDEMSGWQKVLSIGTDLLVLSPIIGKGLSLVTPQSIKGFTPRIGTVPVAIGNIGGKEIRISRIILLPSQRSVAAFEKLKASVAKEWSGIQEAGMLPREGEALLPNAVLNQLEGLPFTEKVIIEYPYRFSTAESKLQTIWGQAVKRPGAVTLYTAPTDEALAEIPELGKASKLGEGGYGTGGKMSKEAFEKEVQRVRLSNILDEKPWEMKSEVKTTIKEQELAAKDKFKTVTERKTVSEPSTKTASETERLENIKRYAPTAKKIFTGASPELVWAVAAMIASTTVFPVSTGKPVTISTPEIIKTTTTVMPDIQTTIKQVTQGDTDIDIVTQQAIEQALQEMAKVGVKNLTDAQIKVIAEEQVKAAIRNQVDTEVEVALKTELEQKLLTKTKLMIRNVAKVATKIADKIRLIPKMMILLPEGGSMPNQMALSYEGAIGWQQGELKSGKVFHIYKKPWHQEDYEIVVADKPPEGMRLFPNATKAIETLQVLTGEFPGERDIDIGAFQLQIKGTRQLKGRYVRRGGNTPMADVSAKEAKVTVVS